ncbi:NADP-dependent oxidoreductase [Pediococcus pentosaceus]|uniref:NADP-dependent oxidoreductase n=1 Tax=Pediococcus pentosaceus TaxID=1255 RepID=UPI000CFFE5DC|nr:NADP-dependent oxidoreductase [Pediococcus pentosaceus]AVL02481.1 NADPH:quinone reductase [Pediococcus pentosaceus]MBF7134491.1 NADP-dependent oxidoreductase [Pediococcus pentosaceus]QPT36608.1 NADP-dependent oxidoreductase [Pediococcus pentosaceus]
MKAITISAYGDVDQLHEEELDIPQIANDEVLVKIKATSINPIDWKARMGFLKQMYDWQFPVVLGWDLSGIITQVGKDVKHFKVGDEVFARPDIYEDGTKGTYAEYAAVKEDKLALKPSNVSFEAAAAIPLAGLTAWQVIVDRLKVKKGDKVLIQAGAGGVGIFAIQIAKHLGAYVATTASAKNAEFLTNLGADEVIDYHEHQIGEVLKQYDAVFDTVDDLEAGLAILKPTGKLVTIAGRPTQAQQDAQPSATSWWLQSNGKQLAELGDLVAKGEVKVIIDSTFPLTEDGLRAAHERSQTNHARGKIVINVE